MTTQWLQHRAACTYGSALMGSFRQWNKGPHRVILCSTWTPQENYFEKGNNRATIEGPHKTRSVGLCVCYRAHFRYLLETTDKTKGKQKVSTWKFWRLGCSTRKFVCKVYGKLLSAWDKGKNKRMLHKDAFSRMPVWYYSINFLTKCCKVMCLIKNTSAGKNAFVGHIDAFALELIE